MERRQLSLLASEANTLKPQTSQELSAVGKILTKSATTSTIVITTQSIETLTEVRTKNSDQCHDSLLIKKPLSYYSLPFSSPTSSSPSQSSCSVIPKKPPRLNKLTHSKSSTDTLPSIPEIHSPIAKIKKKTIYQSSESSSEDNSLGHRCLAAQQQTVDIYPYLVLDKDSCNNGGRGEPPPDSEFINSEFYIDESLPSSLNSDRQDEQFLRQLKDECSSDDNIHQMDDRYLSSDNIDFGKLISDSEAVISLLQVYYCCCCITYNQKKSENNQFNCFCRQFIFFFC